MKNFGAVRVFSLLILVLILSVAPTVARFFSNADTKTESLFGTKSELLGVLRVWNVDTFDGGSASKSWILEKISILFEKQNKGLFVDVENLTEEEFLIRKDNEAPDVICFGSGLFENVKNLAVETPSSDKIYENVYESCILNGKSVAVPWCAGAYFFITTKDTLLRNEKENAKLTESLYDLNYTKKVGKRTKNVWSLTFGENKFHSKKQILEALGDVEVEKIDPKSETQTDYEAYTSYCQGNASVLFGTQRDVARMQNKVVQGALKDVVFEMCSITDMVQYAVATTQEDDLRVKYAKKFCLFLQTSEAQKIVGEAGLFPVLDIGDAQILSQKEKIWSLDALEIKKIY